MRPYSVSDRILERLSRIETRLAGVELALHILFTGDLIMSKELDDLTAQVEENTEVEGSAVALINGIAAQLTALAAELANVGVDNSKVTALAAQLRSSADALAAAVAANTPAAG